MPIERQIREYLHNEAENRECPLLRFPNESNNPILNICNEKGAKNR